MAKGLDDGVISAPIIPGQLKFLKLTVIFIIILLFKSRVFQFTRISGMGLADDIFEQMNRDIAPASILATTPNLLVPDDISVQKQVIF